MADEPNVPEARPHHPQPAWVKYVILTAIAVVLIILVQWAAGLRTESVRRDTFATAVDALSASLAQAMVEHNTSKLQSTVQRIADATGYQRITVTDEKGQVQCSTDRTLDGKTLEDLKDGPLKTAVSTRAGQMIGKRAIVLAGDTKVGGLEVVASL